MKNSEYYQEELNNAFKNKELSTFLKSKIQTSKDPIYIDMYDMYKWLNEEHVPVYKMSAEAKQLLMILQSKGYDLIINEETEGVNDFYVWRQNNEFALDRVIDEILEDLKPHERYFIDDLVKCSKI